MTPVVPRLTATVGAAAALAAVVSPGTWGAWQDTAHRAGGLHTAEFDYSLTGDQVTGGTGFSWALSISVGASTKQFILTNTGSVPETIRANVSISGLGAEADLYSCPVPFTGAITCASRTSLGTVTPGTSPKTVTLASTLAAGASRHIAIQVPGLLGLLGLAVTVTIPAASFAISPPAGSDRTAG